MRNIFLLRNELGLAPLIVIKNILGIVSVKRRCCQEIIHFYFKCQYMHYTHIYFILESELFHLLLYFLNIQWSVSI